MTDDFIIYALAAGLGTSLITGPLGAFIVWRRMAFFGETLSHSALTGVALGLLLGSQVWIGVLGVPIAIALLLAAASGRKSLATDAWLAVISHGTLAVGLTALAFVDGKPLELNGYLFGDILAVSESDLLVVLSGSALSLGVLLYIWRPLLAMTVNEDLAAVEGVQLMKTRLIFMLLIAATVGVALKILGALLLTAMLIIPAAAARRFSKTPEQMAFFAGGVGMASVLAGVYGSLAFDTPASASIVLASLLAFIASWALPERN